MTAAASKYIGTTPISLNTERGKMPGATVATTLYPQATSTPRLIRVNMLRLRVASDCTPRTWNTQPPHSATGVARASSIHW